MAELVQVHPKFVQDRGMSLISTRAKLSEEQQENDRLARRFFAALVLHDLIQEVSNWVARWLGSWLAGWMVVGWVGGGPLMHSLLHSVVAELGQ